LSYAPSRLAGQPALTYRGLHDTRALRSVIAEPTDSALYWENPEVRVYSIPLKPRKSD